MKVTRETVHALWQGPFVHRPDQAVVLWVSSSQAAARALMQRLAPGSGKTAWGSTTLSRGNLRGRRPHGMGDAPARMRASAPARDFPRAPAWLVEGLPALFEVAQIDGDALRFGAHFRLQTLRTALAIRRRPPR